MNKRRSGLVLLGLLLAGVTAGITYSAYHQQAARRAAEAAAQAEAASVVRQGDPAARAVLEPARSPLVQRPPCEIAPAVRLSPSTRVLAASTSASKRTLAFQIDQSGNTAGQVDAVVNSPDAPVALLLIGYAPTIWNIKWTPGTKIEAVVLSGYHGQVPAGLAKSTPRLVATYDNKSACGYLSPSGEQSHAWDAFSQKVYGRPVTGSYPVKDPSAAMIGSPAPGGTSLLTSPDAPPESYFDPNLPLAGRPGLDAAVRSGILRVPSEEEAAAWLRAFYRAAHLADDLPPVLGESSYPAPGAGPVGDYYAVLKPLTFPPALTGSNSAIFFITKGAPRPKGDPGHSTVFDLNTMTCTGLDCR